MVSSQYFVQLMGWMEEVFKIDMSNIVVFLLLMYFMVWSQVSRLSDRPYRRRSVHKLFYTLHPCWIHHNLKENYWILDPVLNMFVFKYVSIFIPVNLKCFYTLHSCLIHHNLKENNWILLSWQYAHLQMARKHCTKFQVYLISGLGGEALARFCDRQMARKYKNMSPPERGET